MKATTLFICGEKPNHECNDNGPMVYGGDGVPTVTDQKLAGKGYTWGSVTCSICGSSNMARSMWGDF